MGKANSVKGASPAAKRAAEKSKKATAKAEVKSTNDEVEITAEDLAALEEVADTVEASEINLESLESEIETAESKAASYASQEAEVAAAPVAAVAAAAKGPGRRNLTGVKPSERITSAFADPDALKAALTFHEDEASVDPAAVLTAADAMAKKVGEKFVNTVINRERPASMSVFTRLAVQALTSEGSITSNELVDLYKNCAENKGAGYGIGTARSQASQMVQLLPALRIATRVGKSLEVDKGSLILKQIQATS